MATGCGAQLRYLHDAHAHACVTAFGSFTDPFRHGVGAATQHPIGSALVTRAFSGARSLKAFGAYNFAGDVGKVLLPATATSLLLILPWRPAYTLLGLA